MRCKMVSEGEIKKEVSCYMFCGAFFVPLGVGVFVWDTQSEYGVFSEDPKHTKIRCGFDDGNYDECDEIVVFPRCSENETAAPYCTVTVGNLSEKRGFVKNKRGEYVVPLPHDTLFVWNPRRFEAHGILFQDFFGDVFSISEGENKSCRPVKFEDDESFRTVVDEHAMKFIFPKEART